MSGHSKWSTIRHKKALNDAKKGKAFSKLSVQITHAARQGGGDINMNPTLRLYVEKARRESFPVDRIEKAIAKGSGVGSDGVQFEEITYEGFGPFGIQIIVDTLTDNRNRTVADVRKTFEDIGGNMGNDGSVSWNFDIKGLIVLRCGHMKKSDKFGGKDEYIKDNRDEVSMKLMDVNGILDIQEIDIDGIEGLEVYTEYKDLASVRDSISKLGYVLEEAEIIKEAKMKKELNSDELDRALESLERFEDLDDVQNVWSDINNQ